MQRTSETVELVIFNHRYNHLALQSHSNLLPLKSLKNKTKHKHIDGETDGPEMFQQSYETPA